MIKLVIFEQLPVCVEQISLIVLMLSFEVFDLLLSSVILLPKLGHNFSHTFDFLLERVVIALDEQHLLFFLPFFF